ncbi:MAG: DUF2961 domain-containing protein [Pirellulales bacterium]|nr:DUF2961 domain-containing protein [Pirellulales bacterium]
MRQLVLGVLVSLIALTAFLFSGSTAPAGETLSYVELVDRMIDLEHLAVLPAPGETCKQWSSYDRASRYDEATGKYIHWDANGDGGQYIRKENGEFVLAEMEGPGCIWRIWSARAQKGRVKIYLDGSETPAVDLPFEKYFSGDTAPFDYPQLSYDLNLKNCSGQNLYFPIPYRKSCKIVAEKGWGAYYQFNYVTYPEGTEVPTFSADLSAEAKAALAKVNDFIATKLGTDPAGARQGEVTLQGEAAIPAESESEPLRIEGARAITMIRGKTQTPFKDREDQMAAMRQLALEIRFDGQEDPAVWCPVGDFFGTAPGVNYYKSLPLGMTKDGFYCFWYMPFGESAELRIVNNGPTDRTFEFEVTHAPLDKPMEQLGYFHCKWHRDVFPLPKDRDPDWVMLKTEGRGRFCGVNLHVWNPRGGWWGEGDEKFFVDGEKFPSTFGTGSEDYFGYAWCHPGLFQEAFHGQSMTENNAGHQSVHRWQIAENIPFQQSFEGIIEKYYPNQKPTLYACTVQWYLAAGGVDPFPAVPVEERYGYCVRPPMAGLKVLSVSRGAVQLQEMDGWKDGKWKDDDQLWWTHARPGAKLNLALPVKEEGHYKISVVLTKAPDYAVVQFFVDGEKAGEPIDLYNEKVTNTEPIALGTFELSAGEHQLTVEITGANDQAQKSYMFGIDQLILKKTLEL